jgi:hypothetical protein
MKLDLAPDRFPFQFQGKKLTFQRAEAFLKLKDGATAPSPAGIDLFLTEPSKQPDENNDKLPLQANSVLPGLFHGGRDLAAGKPGTWLLWAKKADLEPLADAIEDLFVVYRYSVQGRAGA